MQKFCKPDCSVKSTEMLVDSELEHIINTSYKQEFEDYLKIYTTHEGRLNLINSNPHKLFESDKCKFRVEFDAYLNEDMSNLEIKNFDIIAINDIPYGIELSKDIVNKFIAMSVENDSEAYKLYVKKVKRNKRKMRDNNYTTESLYDNVDISYKYDGNNTDIYDEIPEYLTTGLRFTIFINNICFYYADIIEDYYYDLIKEIKDNPIRKLSYMQLNQYYHTHLLEMDKYLEQIYNEYVRQYNDITTTNGGIIDKYKYFAMYNLKNNMFVFENGIYKP